MPDAPPHRFIVPLKGVSTFCTFRDGGLVPENPLPMVGFDGHATDPEFGWVAWVADGGKAIGRTHLDAIEGEGGFAPLPMPEGYTAGCLLFHRQVLFVGGNCGTEVIGRFDFASSEPKWVPLDVPEQFRRHGKRVDDVLLDGDRLIAVDNCIEPKYLLLYDVTDARLTRYLETRDLPVHGTYEEIHRGALGPDRMALLSSSMNHGWSGLHIAVYDRPTLTEQVAMTVTRKGSYRRDERETARDWRDVALRGNTLLIAAGVDGIGVLDLTASADSISRRLRDTARRALGREPARWELGDRRLGRMRYQSLPTRYEGYAVNRVVAVPETNYYLALVDTEPGYDTVVMELP